MENSKSFTNLKVWQCSHELVLLIYAVTKSFPRDEIYGLTSQLRRASVSVSSNIAEGYGRWSYKEKLNFYYKAHGSLIEVKNQLLVARDVGIINSETYTNSFYKTEDVQKLLLGFIRKTNEIIST